MAQATRQNAKKPAHEIRRGSIKALIWENVGASGRFYRFTLVRLYKDGETWKSTSSFGATDIPKLSTVLLQAEEWLGARTRAEPAA